MSNKQYLSGVRFERYVKKEHEACGLIVLRTAGSHGFADLVTINPVEGDIVFIQCKVLAKGANPAKLGAAWKAKPPLPIELFKYQMLAVKVKGEKEYRAYWA